MRPARVPLPIAFGAFGSVWGAWQAAVPDLAATFGLGTGPLGLILTGGVAVSLPVMLGTGRLMDRLGSGTAIALTAGTMAAGLLVVASLHSLPVLVVGIVLLIVGSGAFDVAINGAALGDPGWSRPARLTLLHAAFSGGGVLGAVAAGALLSSGSGIVLVYLALGAALAGIAVVAARDRTRAGGEAGEVPTALARAMLPLAVLAALAFLAEGSMETWSALYLRDVLGAAAFVGALGPGAFHAAMLAGRLVGAGVAGSLGARPTLLLAGAMIVGGMAAAMASPAPPPAIAGMAVAALGAAFVVPVVVSQAGRRAGAHAGRAASYVLSLGYAGFLVGPSLVGVLGELVGLRLALAVIPAAAVVIIVVSRTRAVPA